MKSLQDALYNWLTIKVVTDVRPDDAAALETEEMFFGMLENEHGVSDIEVTKDDVMYYVHYQQKGERKMYRYPRELIEVMLDQINAEPEKYRNFPEE
ncbi:hypothetical protein [Bacillus dakarensis]|uniref:hypothetical protein n=1 Tax=Robertmurraya dakarensis TaxID=1926278 RepID=UPI00098245D4|nr:hypothetical protein [Bacillus dakarensis]